MTQDQKKTFQKYRLDIIVICAVLLLSLSVLLLVSLTRTDGSYAVLEINGEAVAEYPLSVDATYILNGGTNTLVIKNGKARLIDSDCPDHTCERVGEVWYSGESIVCLPNKLAIRITGGPSGVDFVS